MAILTVNNIKKMFGTDVILENVSFEVQKGDRYVYGYFINICFYI